MRKLTAYGKRVMATVGLILAIAAVITLGILVLGNGARLFHINQQVFNLLGMMIGLPICCTVIVDMICIIRHGRLI